MSIQQARAALQQGRRYAYRHVWHILHPGGGDQGEIAGRLAGEGGDGVLVGCALTLA